MDLLLENSILAPDESMFLNESVSNQDSGSEIGTPENQVPLARPSEPYPGLSDESKRRRQAVYLPTVMEGFAPDAERRAKAAAAAAAASLLPPEEQPVPVPVPVMSIADYEPVAIGGAAKGESAMRENLLLRARFDRDPAQPVNVLDEAAKVQTSHVWWRRSPPRADPELQDMPPDMFMDVCFPKQGFYINDEQAQYSWNRRYQGIYNMAESADRRSKFKAFVEEFTAAAVPVAKYLLANLSKVKSPLMHHVSGFTVEFCGLTIEGRSLFEDSLRGHKLTNREFWGRNLVLAVSCPQLAVPYSLMVEHLGAKGLVYPSVPVQQFCSSPELVYGMEEPCLFHEKVILQSDAEVNSIVQRLGTYIKMKGHWMGSELKYKKFLCAPLDFRVYRSAIDNRIYALGLKRCTASTSILTSDDYQSNDSFVDILRPEFVLKTQQNDLNCDSALHLSVVNREKDEAERLTELQVLYTYLIPQAVEQMSRDTRISEVDWDYFEKGGMAHFLHSWGINMRFLPLVHQKLQRTKLSGLAQGFVEIELTVRALKSWIFTVSRRAQDGSVAESDVANHVLLILQPMDQGLWDSIVWPMITKKYPPLSAGAPWKFNRLNNAQLLGRFLVHVGVEVRNPLTISASLNAKRVPLTAAAILARTSLDDLCITLAEKVQCAVYPKAALEEGLDVHLMVIAKRYLRGVSHDLKYNPLASRDTVDRYIEFLSQVGERECEEIGAFYKAELERKDRLLNGSKAVIQETVSDRIIKYRLKNNNGLRLMDVSREACDLFRLYNGQKVQITLGATAGRFSNIVGVHEGSLFKHDDNEDGASEVIGRNAMEVQANYGFVVLDRLISNLKQTASSAALTVSGTPGEIDLTSVALVKPYHQPNDRTLLIYESNQEQLNLTFGISHGDRLLFIDGPKKGSITTVLGTIDGVMWHQHDTELHQEAYRFPEKERTSVLHDPRKLVAYFESARATFASYPIDSKGVYDPMFQLFAGFRFMLPFGFYFRQMLVLRSGPYSGRKGVVMGVAAQQLHVLLQHDPIPVSLGLLHRDIVEEHAPKSLGYLAYEPTAVAKPLRTCVYPAMNGELLLFDTSCSSCVAFGAVSCQRIKITSGSGGGSCGVVIGVRSGKLWAHLHGEDGARPIPVNTVQVLSGSIFERDPSVLVQDLFPSKRSCAEEDELLEASFLTVFGEIVTIELTPKASRPFGYYHGQVLRILKTPLTAEHPNPTGDVVNVTVVGVFLNELWCITDGECFVRPLAARTRWELDSKFCPSVVGLNLLKGFRDMFCPRSERMMMAKHDQFLVVPNIEILKMRNGERIGVDTRHDSIKHLWQPWHHDLTIIRQDRIVTDVDKITGAVTHRPDGPQAVVVGAWDGQIFLIERGSDYATIAKNPTKWLPCKDWRTLRHNSRLRDIIDMFTPLPTGYEKRLGFDRTVDSTAFRWWARVHCKTKQLALLDTTLHMRLENARKVTKSNAVIYDSEGRKYSIETMTMYENDPITEEPIEHEMRLERCETVQTYCLAAFQFDIERLLPDLMESILHRVACRMAERLDGRRPRVLVESRKVHTVFCTPAERDILHECCEIVPDAVTNDVERCAALLGPDGAREFCLRLHALPASLHTLALRWVLRCTGLKTIDPRWPVQQLCGMVCVMEKLLLRYIDLPTLKEMECHIEQELKQLWSKERTARAEILQEEMVWWRRVPPSFAQNLANDPYFANRDAAPDAAAALSAIPTSSALQGYSDECSVDDHRFVLSDTTIIRFQPSCMSFRRGDVVGYTFGDINGIEAVILGMESGRLWRYETSGRHACFAMPFEGTEVEIVHRYGLKKKRWEHVGEDKILKCNPLRYVTYDGALVQFDTACDRIFSEFGVMPGERYVVGGKPGAAVMPYAAGTVLVMIGLHRNQLWFIIDQTGALPFPSKVKNPVEHYGLRRISCGPIVFPNIEQPGRLVRFMAFLSPEEALFLESGVTAFAVFNIAPAAFAPHGAAYLLPLQVTQGDPDKELLRDKRIVVIGVRHGSLYIQMDGDATARRLRCKLSQCNFKPGLLLLQDPPTPVFAPNPHDEAEFRFGTQRGGLGVFDATQAACAAFGLRAGQVVRYAPNAKKMGRSALLREAKKASQGSAGGAGPAAIPPPREAVILGVRQGSLWRVDKFDKEAKPFIGVSDRSTLLDKLTLEEGSVVRILSQTW